MEAPKRVITAIVRVDGALRAQLDCGHLANVLARDLDALNRRVGTERYCYECATQGKEQKQMTPEEKDARNVERMQAAQRRNNMLHEALDVQERSTIWSALSTAAGTYDESVKTFRDVAVAIRRGESVGMFAMGEPGARAADRLVAQFEMQARDARALMERFE